MLEFLVSGARHPRKAQRIGICVSLKEIFLVSPTHDCMRTSFCAKNSTTGCFIFSCLEPICPIDCPGNEFHTKIIESTASMLAAFLQQFASTTDSNDTIASNPTRVPQEMVRASNHSSDRPSTDEERDDELYQTNNQPILQSPKTVRFAMDDKVANRKKRNRNLRNRILEKSKSATERNSNTTTNNIETVIATDPTLPSSPKKTTTQVERRRKNFKLAASLFAGLQC